MEKRRDSGGMAQPRNGGEGVSELTIRYSGDPERVGYAVSLLNPRSPYSGANSSSFSIYCIKTYSREMRWGEAFNHWWRSWLLSARQEAFNRRVIRLFVSRVWYNLNMCVPKWLRIGKYRGYSDDTEWWWRFQFSGRKRK